MHLELTLFQLGKNNLSPWQHIMWQSLVGIRLTILQRGRGRLCPLHYYWLPRTFRRPWLYIVSKYETTELSVSFEGVQTNKNRKKLSFSLTFNLLHLQMEFVSIFQEGKELAEQSEILEQPHAGSLNPDDIYYGQGMWPDRVGQTNNDENAAAQWLRLGITACDPNLAIALANFISSEKIELQPLDEWIKKIVNCLKRWENFK